MPKFTMRNNYEFNITNWDTPIFNKSDAEKK